MSDLFDDWPVVIEMTGEPTGKGRPRFSRATGAVYTPEKTARYEERLAWTAQGIMRGRPLFENALEVEVWAHMSVPASKPKRWISDARAGLIFPVKKPDADNFAKCLDALNKVVWLDDSQICDLRVFKRYSEQPRLVVKIRGKTR